MMSRFLPVIFLVFSFVLMIFAALDLRSAPGARMSHRVVSLKLKDYHRDLRYLAESGFDIAGVSLKDSVVDVIVNDQEWDSLRMRLTEGVQLIGEKSIDAAPDQEYLNYDEMVEVVRETVDANADIMQMVEIGKSLEQRPIFAVKISDNIQEQESEEPIVLVNAMHHAREVMTTEVAVDMIQNIAETYRSDAQMKARVDALETWVVPMVNPDGNNKVWHSDSMWRKNARGGYGVDINRNYPEGWNSCNGSSANRNQDDYRGESPASEPETQTMMKLVQSIRPVLNISLHSYSEMVLYPYGCRPNRTMSGEPIETIGKEMARLLVSDSSNSRFYTPGTPWQLLYNADGGDIDFMYQRYQVVPYVIEVSARDVGFQPSYSRYRQKTVEKLRKAWTFIMDRALKSGVQGNIVGWSADELQSAEVTLRNATNQMVVAKPYRLDGRERFHFVTNQGRYAIEVKSGTKIERATVVVGSGLERIIVGEKK